VPAERAPATVELDTGSRISREIDIGQDATAAER
jgi:hypothetical protein